MYCFVRADEGLTQERVKQAFEKEEALKRRHRHSELSLGTEKHISEDEC